METNELVTDVLRFYDHKADPTAVVNASLRKETKFAAQLAFNTAWTHRFWHFRWQSATVEIADGVGELPADFLNVGRGGGVFFDTALPPLQWIPLRDMTKLRLSSAQTGMPGYYTIAGTVPDATAVSRSLLLYPMDTRDVTLVYERKAPTLLDEDDADDETLLSEADSGLPQMPSQWHLDVVYHGTIYHRMKGSANAQSITEQLALFREGLAKMVDQERQGVEAPHSLVPYGAGRL
jgi:hypothetical protein